MNALGSLKDPEHKYERGLSDVDVLLGATREVEHRMQGPQRAWQIWRKELWFGRYLLKRYNVLISTRPLFPAIPRLTSFAVSGNSCSDAVKTCSAGNCGEW